MNVLNTLIWTILYTTVIYRNNVVYCAEGGTDQSSTSPESQPASTTPPSTPASGTNESGKTASSDSSNKTGVTLDIKKDTKPTNKFNHKKDGKVVTYTAKGDYAFSVVKQKNTEIWKTDNSKEYAEKVVMDGKGKKDKTIIIYLPGNKTKVYKKEKKNKKWKEEVQSEGEVTEGSKPKEETSSEQTGTESTKDPSDTSGGGTGTGTGSPPSSGGGSHGTSGGGPTSGSQGGGDGGTGTGGGTGTVGQGGGGGGTTPTNENQQSDKPNSDSQTKKLKPEEYPKDIKVFTGDTSDSSNLKELETDKYKVSQDGDDFIYELNEGVQCTKVQKDSKDVWTYDSSKNEGKYFKKINIAKENAFIYFEDKTEVYTFLTNEWVFNATLTNMLNRNNNTTQGGGGGGTTPNPNESSGGGTTGTRGGTTS